MPARADTWVGPYAFQRYTDVQTLDVRRQRLVQRAPPERHQDLVARDRRATEDLVTHRGGNRVQTAPNLAPTGDSPMPRAPVRAVLHHGRREPGDWHEAR